MKGYRSAQVKVAKMGAPIKSRIMADGIADLDRMNALVQQNAGFVWRFKETDKKTTSLKVFEDDLLLINMSVCETKEPFFNFTYDSEHIDIFRGIKAWLQRMTDLKLALWFIPENHRPTVAGAKQCWEYFDHNGETPYSFRFKGDCTSSETDNYVILK